MSEPSSLLEMLSEEALWRLEEMCCRFEAALRTGARPRLEDFLAGVEDSERQARLRELLRLELHYRRRAGEGLSSREYATRFPDATGIVNEVFVLASLQGPETVDDVGGTSAPGVEGAPACGPPDSPSGGAPVGRFQVLRFHAEGGLGRVFVAEDTELRREVALKEIKKERADRADSQGRFLLEAETTGRLEHPGIVPVYGLGTYSDGRPYYAMRFIHGESLTKAIERFHTTSPVRFESLQLRQLLGRFVAVCQAVAYAHSRGVLHRDLKPDNIMLGRFGETLVVDWGLAKVLGRTDERLEVSRQAGALPSERGHGETAAGQVLGTPAYMSPEQASGELEQLGPATDVYGLGATLYVLLTNRAPFEGKVLDVLRQVQQGAWVPPRLVNPALPAALDAICCKAMALLPAGRYASALELASDLEQWLADEPVKAYRDPLSVRLRRWMRKYPRRVTAAAVFLLSAVVGLTLGSALLERSKREAQENFEMAQKEANQYLEAVGEDVVLDEPGLRPLRQRLLKDTLDHYLAFLARKGNPSARQQMAEAERQLGELYGQIDRLAEAEPLLLHAVHLYEELREADPESRPLRLGLAQVQHTLAALKVQAGQPEAGKQALDRALELLEGLQAEEPRSIEVRSLRARSYDLRAAAEADRGNLEAALADNAQAREALPESTAESSREDERARFHLLDRATAPGIAPVASVTALRHSIPLRAQVLGHRGHLLLLAGRTGESAQQLGTAVVAQRFCVRAAPRSSRHRARLVRVLLDAGLVETELGRPARGEAFLREALPLVGRLLEEDPAVAEHHDFLAQAAGRLAESLFAQGRTSPARDWLGEAVRRGEEPRSRPTRDHAQRTGHARALSLLGCLQAETGDLTQGLQSCTQALKEQQQVLALSPGNPWLRSELLGTREALARFRVLGGQPHEDGIETQRQILAERKALAGECPSAQFRGEVSASGATLADLLLKQGRAGEALALVDALLADHERLVGQEENLSGDPRHQKEVKVSPFSPSGHRREDVWRLGPDAVDLSQDPPRPSYRRLRRQWAQLLGQRGAALIQLGRGEEAVAPARQALALAEGLLGGNREWRCPPASVAAAWSFVAQELSFQEPCYLYDLACLLTLASTLPDRQALPDAAARAVQALHQLIAFGFDNPHRLRTDPALAPLRKRDDFQKLLAGLESKVRAPSKPTPR